MLLLTTGIDFQGQQLQFSEEIFAGKIKQKPVKAGSSNTAPSKATKQPGDTAFIPRAAASKPKPRAGLGHNKRLGKGIMGGQTQAIDGDGTPQTASVSSGKGQDDFRRLLEGK
jgi:hypothetical protein